MQTATRRNLREIVRENCAALYVHRHPGRRMSWWDFATETGIGKGTAQRINESTADPSLSTIERIAEAYGLEPWHVLIPNLDPANPPVVWITDAERTLYDQLAASVRAVAEHRSSYSREPQQP